jgi:hypothetical protein
MYSITELLQVMSNVALDLHTTDVEVGVCVGVDAGVLVTEGVGVCVVGGS